MPEEPETILHDTPNGLGDRADRQSKTVEPELIPKDCGNGNKLGGAKLGPLNLGAGGTSDLKLLARAVKERWPIPESERAKLPVWLLGIVADSELDVRGRVGAAKVLAELDKLNMAQEQADAGGQRIQIDHTTGGRPIVPDVRQLSAEELEARIRALEGGG